MLEGKPFQGTDRCFSPTRPTARLPPKVAGWMVSDWRQKVPWYPCKTPSYTISHWLLNGVQDLRFLSCCLGWFFGMFCFFLKSLWQVKLGELLSTLVHAGPCFSLRISDMQCANVQSPQFDEHLCLEPGRPSFTNPPYTQLTPQPFTQLAQAAAWASQNSSVDIWS